MDIIHHVFEDTPEQLSLDLEDVEDELEDEGSPDGAGDSYTSPHEHIREEGLTR